jgi:hypothetical protein
VFFTPDARIRMLSLILGDDFPTEIQAWPEASSPRPGLPNAGGGAGAFFLSIHFKAAHRYLAQPKDQCYQTRYSERRLPKIRAGAAASF